MSAVLLIPTLFSAALATGSAAPPQHARYAGIALDSLEEELKPPRYDSSSTGYTVDVSGGIVRVFIAPSELAAQWWVQRMAEVRARRHPAPPEPPLPLGADEALLSGDDLAILRFGNLGLMVEASGGALPWVERLQPLFLPELAGAPEPPKLQKVGSSWAVEVPFTPLHVSYVGAHPLPGAPLRFSQPPTSVVVWDRHGRALRQDFDASGQPVPSTPPWIDFEPPPTPTTEPADD